jgi:SprT-like family protein
MPRECAWPRRTGETCSRTTSWLKGEDFDGAEITYWSKFCEYHERKAAQDGIPTNLSADILASLVEYNLVRPDPIECIQWIGERHNFWCERIAEWVSKLGKEHEEAAATSPLIGEISVSARAAAGVYYPATHECRYVLPYAMSQSDYDTIIAHEVCHAYSRAVMPEIESHGEVFQMLMRLAAGFKKYPKACLQYHSYDVQKAIQLGKDIRPRINAAIQAGKIHAWVKM